MNIEKFMDVMYVLGNDVMVKLEQICAMHCLGDITKADEIKSIELTKFVPGLCGQLTVEHEGGKYYLLKGCDIAVRLLFQVESILNLIDDVMIITRKDIPIDFESLIALVSSECEDLINESIDYIKEVI